MIKVRHISSFDGSGGAARAAHRLHRGLIDCGVDSKMWVTESTTGDWSVTGAESLTEKASARLRPIISSQIGRLQRANDHSYRSLNILPSRWPARIAAGDADIFHLHWCNREMLSIEEIGAIQRPLVWTLHDMWAFCGAEHLSHLDRFKEGYRRDNRSPGSRGLDLDRVTWLRKVKSWRRPIPLIVPSRWLRDCVEASALCGSWPVDVIPNGLDTDAWRPIPKRQAREMLQLPRDAQLVMFGAVGGTTDPNKGFDLLQGALGPLRSSNPELELVVFGQHAPKEPLSLGFPTHYLGPLQDDLALRAAYSAADVLVVPSRIESFGQTASEAHACGTPVVAFDHSGLRDIVVHEQTGYLAKPFAPQGLADGVSWVLEDEKRRARVGRRARRRAVAEFDVKRVVEMTQAVYERVLSQDR